MALAPENAVISEGYVQLFQRLAFKESKIVPIPAGTTVAAQTDGIVIPVPTGQAIRFSNLGAGAFDLDLSGKLICGAASITANPGNSAGIITFPSYGTNFPFVGGGFTVRGESEELFFWSDFLETGGVPPGMYIAFYVDVTNNDIVDHSVALNSSYLVEMYLQRQQGVGAVGFPPFQAKP